MPGEDVELVRRYYEAMSSGDLEAAAAFLAPDVEADFSRRLVEPGVARGREAVMAAAARVREAWADLTVEPEELFEFGERVVAVVHSRGTGRGSGASVDACTAQVWRVREGLAVHWEYFGSKTQALEALGRAAP